MVLWYYFGILLLSISPILAAEPSTEELQEVRTRIKQVKTQIQDAEVELGQLQEELRNVETRIALTSEKAREIGMDINENNATLATHQEEQGKLKTELDAEKRKLIAHIRMTYQASRGGYLKLILRQDELTRLGRTLAYHNYFQHTQAEHITTIQNTLTDLNNLRISIQNRTQYLLELRTDQQHKLSELQQQRNNRDQVVNKLQEYIAEQGIELTLLEENERELEKLLKKFRQKTLSRESERLKDMPPFANFRGKLDWPVLGKVLKKFGSKKKGGKLSWQGVLIEARVGSNVNAISSGQVIFADWFRNLGLLIIIDHGDGYMSLYGHNQQLLKDTGDWVSTGESIAKSGDSGGQRSASVYFEIRKDTRPLNPIHWCKS